MKNSHLISTQELLEEAKRSILFTTTRPDVVMEKGEGMFLRDTAGKEYLDFVAVGSNSLGHSRRLLWKPLRIKRCLIMPAQVSLKT